MVRTLHPTVGDMGSIPGWGTKIPQAGWSGQKNTENFKKTNKNLTLGLALSRSMKVSFPQP